MTEDKFIDILSQGQQAPLVWRALSRDYQEYYRINPWQVPDTEWGREILRYLKTLDK